jgi:GT2 family glycosyltransferase
MIKVSVVILNWNGADMLRRFLPSVISCSQGEGIEVCVADNGSSDDSCRIVEGEFPSVRLIRLPENYGFADGYNKALEQVDAEYVVLLNSDVEVSSGWLSAMVSYMDLHPEVAACQPKILDWKNKEYFEYAGAAGGFIDRYGYPFCRGRVFDTVEKDIAQYDAPVSIFWATGAALFIRLDKYREVGGLDGRFFAHMEEIDLCWRLRSRGYELVCLPQSVVYHVGGATLKKENPRKTFLNFRNNLLMLYKNLPQKDLKRVLCARFWFDYVAALQLFVTGKRKNAYSVFKARRDYKKLKPSFELKRAEIQRSATKESLETIYSKSIVFNYYLKSKQKFNLLKF